MIPAWSQLANLGAALAFILALKALSSPKTARLGNRIGAVGAIAAVAIVFFSESNLKHLPLILIAVAFGTILRCHKWLLYLTVWVAELQWRFPQLNS